MHGALHADAVRGGKPKPRVLAPPSQCDSEQHPFAENSPGRAVNYVIPPPELNDLSHTKHLPTASTQPRGKIARLHEEDITDLLYSQ